MNCVAARENLLAHTRGELEDEATRAVGAHVESCDDCQRELHSLRELDTLLAATAITPRAGFAREVIEAARATPVSDGAPILALEEVRESLAAAGIGLRRRAWAISLSVAAHAAVFLILTGIAWRSEGPTPESIVKVWWNDAQQRQLFEEEAPGEAGRGRGSELSLSEVIGRGGWDGLGDDWEDEPRYTAPPEDEPSGRSPRRAVGDGIGLGEDDQDANLFVPQRPVEKRRPGRNPGLLAARTDEEARGERLRRYSQVAGSRTLEEAIDRGLRYLAAHQLEDGSWDVEAGGGRESLRVAVTALSVLPFLAEGFTSAGRGDYGEKVVAPAIAWLEGVQDRRSGAMISARGRDGGGTRPMFNHGIATVALCENLAMITRGGGNAGSSTAEFRDRQKAARRALGFLRDAQIATASAAGDASGGWGYHDSSSVTDTNVSGWYVQALLAYDSALRARDSRVSFALEGVFRGVRHWIGNYTDPLTGGVGYDGLRRYGEYGPLTLTAIGMMTSTVTGVSPGTELLEAQQRLLASKGSGFDLESDDEIDFCRGYFITMALYLKDPQSPQFLRWDPDAIRDLLGLQDTEAGEDRGSWPPVCRWSHFGGRYYTTSLALLVLQTPYRLQP